MEKKTKTLKMNVEVEVGADVNPFELTDEFKKLCDQKGWILKGGGVKFPVNDKTAKVVH